MQQLKYTGTVKLIAQRESMTTLDCDISFEDFMMELVMKL